jgi:urease accessory protein
LQGDSRSRAAVGRHARLELAFGCCRGRTVLAEAYAEPPLRIGRTFDVDGTLYLILVSTGPGVFGGDWLDYRISLAPGSRAMIVSQSALQVHPSRAPSPAVVHHEYRVAVDAELHCHWDPVVPFAGARLVQRFDVQVEPGGRLYWSDALMSGRVGRGETWQFASVDHELRLVAAGALKYLERSRLAPVEGRLPGSWVADDAHYLGTSLVYHDSASSAAAERLHRELTELEGLTAAVDLADSSLLVGRFLSGGGVPFLKGRDLFRQRSIDALFGCPHLVARR